jgi:hypothetical protein
VKWPSGAVTKMGKLDADRFLAIKEGEGLFQRPFPRIRRP